MIHLGVRRREDPRLLTGRGRYVTDVTVPGALHLALVRSPHAHARLRGLDVGPARNVPGVVTVLDGEELYRSVGESAAVPLFPLARGAVHYVGEPVAAVVAESRYAAEDGCEAVRVEFEPLPVVADVDLALRPGAPAVREGAPNLASEQVVSYGDVEAAFREAAVVLEERFRIARAAAHPLETRGCLALPDPTTGGLVVWSGAQLPHLLRATLAAFLGLPERSVRVVVPDVGGAFGCKASTYAEDLLVPYLARTLGRPVRFVEDRLEHFRVTLHERQQVHQVRLAATRDGRLLGVHDRFVMDMGAYCLWPHMLMNTANTMPGPYHLPSYRCELQAVLTHKTPAGPYRGAGRPQGNFVMERMMDRLAEATGLDPAEVRRRNLIRREEMPFTTPLGRVYDSGDYSACLEACLERLSYGQWRQRQREARREGRRLGIGLACYVEDTGAVGSFEGAAVRLEADGSFTVHSGAPSSGQSHETTLAQVAAERLGVPLERVRVLPTDTAQPCLGLGTYGSRSAGAAAGAVWNACEQLAVRLREMASALLEAGPEDLELAQGAVRVKGAPARSVSLQELGRLANQISLAPLPPGVLPGAEATAYFRTRPTFGSGTHAAVVEVDPGSGAVSVLAYAVAHDCGTVLNPKVVDGQIHGGVSHGLSTALLEELRYDAGGQPLNASYMDYLLPTAGEMPPIALEHLESPSPFTPTGAKGVGEGGTIPTLAAIANAVEDAVRPLGAHVRELPVSPERLWSELQGTDGGGVKR